MSMLVQSRNEQGEQLTMKDYVATFILMIVAGNETTRNAISGGMLALDEHRAQKNLLIENPDLMPSAVSEIVRWVSPVVYMRRTATCDTTIGDKHIRDGDKVVLWYGSGNRDEEIFENPYRFDVSRVGPAHLGFGTGAHFCIGSRLAELQLKVLFRALLHEFPAIRIAGPVDGLRSSFINGIKRMPVALQAE